MPDLQYNEHYGSYTSILFLKNGMSRKRKILILVNTTYTSSFH